jgi:hypothetical protein
MGVAAPRGRDREATVEFGQQTTPQQFIGLTPGCHSRETHFFDPAILRRAKEAFHAPFGQYCQLHLI